MAEKLSTDPVSVVVAFNQALNDHSVDEMMRCMSPDCVFENTSPNPDGARYEGQAAVRVFWEEFFRNSPAARIEIEDIFACGRHCIMRWRYEWVDRHGQPGHVRGADLYIVENGRIAEKLSYVKG